MFEPKQEVVTVAGVAVTVRAMTFAKSFEYLERRKAANTKEGKAGLLAWIIWECCFGPNSVRLFKDTEEVLMSDSESVDALVTPVMRINGIGASPDPTPAPAVPS